MPRHWLNLQTPSGELSTLFGHGSMIRFTYNEINKLLAKEDALIRICWLDKSHVTQNIEFTCEDKSSAPYCDERKN